MTANEQITVLVVDDNQSIRKAVSEYLAARGYKPVEAADGIKGLQLGLTCSPDVIILDVVMPGMDGFKVCQMLRSKNVAVPVIMLTERTAIEDKVEGFTLGADDYLGKPFSPLELEMRIQALVRRAAGQPPERLKGLIEHGDLRIDLDRHWVKIKGRDAGLTPIEFNILKVLASSPGKVFSRDDLLNLIWDTQYEGYKRNIDPHVTRLRTKIEENPRKPRYILTVWGTGYRFNDGLS
ncbi:MAG TPA: response regulator transcription factor [Blastocatellia bacterium]|nr:response regulator transcription factor [Blastocatellia bacterium]